MMTEMRAEMERLVIKSKDGSVYYYDAERGLKLESCEVAPHQRRKMMERLHAYEDTGLTPAEILELKERDTAEEPIKDTDSGVRYTGYFICPNCRKHFTGTRIAKFCYHCGRRIKWYE